MLAKLKNTFNNSEYSNCQLTDGNNNACYINTYVLSISSSYFKAFFSSQLQNDKSILRVDNFPIAKLLMEYMYTDIFNVPENINAQDFMALTDYIEMWDLPLKYKLLDYLASDGVWKWMHGGIFIKLLKQHIEICGFIAIHFPSPDHLFPMYNIRKYLINNPLEITKEMLTWPLIINLKLSKETLGKLYIKHGLFNNLFSSKFKNPLDFSNIIDQFVETCPRSTFTHKQFSLIKSNFIISLYSFIPYYHGDILIISSLIPFKVEAKLEYVGNSFGKSKKYNSVFSEIGACCSSLNKNDKIILVGQRSKIKYNTMTVYDINTIRWYDQTVDTAYANEKYSIGLVQNLPKGRKFQIYKLI